MSVTDKPSKTEQALIDKRNKENAIFSTFAKSMKVLSTIIHADNVEKGFWDEKEINMVDPVVSDNSILIVK